MEKDEKEKEKEKIKEKPKEKTEERPKRGLQLASLILIIVLILIVLIVVQVPYTTTNAVKEMVPVEKCAQEDIPFVSAFKTGWSFDNALSLSSSGGVGSYKYSELKTNLYAYIKNAGDEAGIYCVDVEVSLVNGDTSEILDNSDAKYTYPVCTESPIAVKDSSVISLWTSNIISKDIKDNNDLDNVKVTFTIVPPTTEKCHTENVEQTSEQEVTRYCNAWKHLVGKC
jgi:hypothetical protein